MQLMVLAEQVAADIVLLFQDVVFPASRRAQPLTVDQVKAAERLQLLGVVAECSDAPGWYHLEPPKRAADPYLALIEGTLRDEMPTKARADLALDGEMRLFSVLAALRDAGATELESSGLGEAITAGIAEPKIVLVDGDAQWRIQTMTIDGPVDLTAPAWLALVRIHTGVACSDDAR